MIAQEEHGRLSDALGDDTAEGSPSTSMPAVASKRLLFFAVILTVSSSFTYPLLLSTRFFLLLAECAHQIDICGSDGRHKRSNHRNKYQHNRHSQEHRPI
jgi:hypothetical protein